MHAVDATLGAGWGVDLGSPWARACAGGRSFSGFATAPPETPGACAAARRWAGWCPRRRRRCWRSRWRPVSPRPLASRRTPTTARRHGSRWGSGRSSASIDPSPGIAVARPSRRMGSVRRDDVTCADVDECAAGTDWPCPESVDTRSKSSSRCSATTTAATDSCPVGSSGPESNTSSPPWVAPAAREPCTATTPTKEGETSRGFASPEAETRRAPRGGRWRSALPSTVSTSTWACAGYAWRTRLRSRRAPRHRGAPALAPDAGPGGGQPRPEALSPGRGGGRYDPG